MTSDRPDDPAITHERVRSIFFALCDLHGPERDAALEHACAGDESIRVQVLRLLRRDAAEDDLLADDAVDSGAAFAAAVRGERASSREPMASLVGSMPERIGGYRIIRRIGVGGMGTVYEAQQQEPRRIVALKTLQRGAASASLVRRFQHEAQMLGRLQHPGIAQIFEAGVHEPGDGGAAVPFFVMELIRGQPLTAFVRAQSPSVAERLRLFILICDAVGYAHAHGVVHRDLKPDNILVDATGQPKVLDFGIAKSTDTDLRMTTLETGVGQLVGTLPYMSPEQVGGDSSKVDGRSDVYALGVLLYELLAARLPHDLRDKPLVEAIRIVREGSHTHLSEIDRAFRGDLETIVAKALEKLPERRYQSVAALSSDVQRFLDHEPIAARPPSTFYQLSKFTRRNKALVGGVCGVMLALLLGVVGTTRYAMVASAREAQQRWQSYRARVDAASACLDRDDVLAARRHLAAAPAEHRGWEWGFLQRQLQQWELEIDCGAQVVGGVSFLPSREGAESPRVVAALVDHGAAGDRLSVWDLKTGRTTRSIPIADGIAKVSRRAAGSLLAVLTTRGSLLLVDVDAADGDSALVEDQGWGEKGELPLGLDAVNDLAVAPDGGAIFVAATDGVLAWSRQERRVLWHHSAPSPPTAPGSIRGFRALSLSPDGGRLFATQRREPDRHWIWSWNAATGAVAGPGRHGDAGRTVAQRPGSDQLAVGSKVRDVLIFDATTMTPREQLTGHGAGVREVLYSPDGRVLASLSGDGTIRLRGSDDHRLSKVLYLPEALEPSDSAAPPAPPAPSELSESAEIAQHSGWAELAERTDALCFSADGTRLATHDGRRIVVWKVSDEGSLVLRGHRNFAYHVAFSPSGDLLASSAFRGSVWLWDPVTGEALAQLARAGSPTSLEFVDDGGAIAAPSGGRDRWWDTATGQRSPGDAIGPTDNEQRSSSAPKARRIARGRVIDPTGHFEAAIHGGRSGAPPPPEVVALTTLTSAAPPALLRHRTKVRSAAFSPSGALLAVGCESGEITIWDLARREPVALLLGHRDLVYALAFTPDGTRLASGSNDSSLRLWDTETWEQVLERHDHTSYIHGLAFSPDGTQLATASGDETVRLWDSRSKAERLEQARTDAERRERMRPRVQALRAESTGPDEVAKRLRADPSLAPEERRAALRVVLEVSEAAAAASAAVAESTIAGTGRGRGDVAAVAADVDEDADPDSGRAAGPQSPSVEVIAGASAADAALTSSAALRPDHSKLPDVSDQQVEAALELAGPNRPELERFLAAFDFDGGQAPGADGQQRVAARWLVANMPGHGSARAALTTLDGREIPFDATRFESLAAAQSELDSLQQAHGPLEFRTVERIPDLVAITAAQLIRNHELAFAAWRNDAWPSDTSEPIPFELFLEHILPYRGTSEPLDPSWREEATVRLEQSGEQSRRPRGRRLSEATTREEAAKAAIAAAKSWVRFRPLYYLHPTDQSWTEMIASRAGRCEDQSNAALFAGRAVGVLIAADFTPFWADRDNNHAWDVRLDASGRGTAKLAHRAAKVYRRKFSPQSGALGAHRRPDEQVPAWLGEAAILDVTDQYVPVSDVALTVGLPPEGERFAYLCVFNAGAWRPIHWAEVLDGHATFTAMGRRVLYLPAWHASGQPLPAGAPFLLLPDGQRRELSLGQGTFALELATEIREASAQSMDTPVPPRLRVEPGIEHELLVWDAKGWRSLGRATAKVGVPARFAGVPAGGLYWLRAEGGRGLERPFVIEDGAVVSW